MGADIGCFGGVSLPTTALKMPSQEGLHMEQRTEGNEDRRLTSGSWGRVIGVYSPALARVVMKIPGSSCQFIICEYESVHFFRNLGIGDLFLKQCFSKGGPKTPCLRISPRCLLKMQISEPPCSPTKPGSGDW